MFLNQSWQILLQVHLSGIKLHGCQKFILKSKTHFIKYFLLEQSWTLCSQAVHRVLKDFNNQFKKKKFFEARNFLKANHLNLIESEIY